MNNILHETSDQFHLHDSGAFLQCAHVDVFVSQSRSPCTVVLFILYCSHICKYPPKTTSLFLLLEEFVHCLSASDWLCVYACVCMYVCVCVCVCAVLLYCSQRLLFLELASLTVHSVPQPLLSDNTSFRQPPQKCLSR